MTSRSRSPLVLVVAALLLVAGCEDPFAPDPSPVPGPRSFVLHDFRTGPITEASAFDLFTASAVRTDQTEGWDVVFYLTPEGQPQLRPRSVLVGGTSNAGIQPVQSSFQGLAEVPEEGYTTDAPVDLAEESVYALRSRRSQGCTRFAKMAVDSVDLDGARLFATAVTNPNCNDRGVEPEVDEEGGTGEGEG